MDTPTSASLESCRACARPQPLCICAYPVLGPAPLPIVILQHPQEQDRLLGTVPLLMHAMTGIELKVGLSWPSLARASNLIRAQSRAWRVLYPGGIGKQPDAKATQNGEDGPKKPVEDRSPIRAVTPSPGWVQGLIVLDGSWDQAKTLWWRNPWLVKIPRLTLTDLGPSIYGRLRREPRPGYVSTLEAVARAVEMVSREGASMGPALRSQFRNLAQRTRDSGLTVPAGASQTKRQRRQSRPKTHA